MRTFKILLLAACLALTIGFGLCGAWGVAASATDFFNHNCRGAWDCITWYFGWMGLGVACVTGLLAWLINRWLKKEKTLPHEP